MTSTNKKKSKRWLAITLVAALALGACGGVGQDLAPIGDDPGKAEIVPKRITKTMDGQILPLFVSDRVEIALTSDDPATSEDPTFKWVHQGLVKGLLVPEPTVTHHSDQTVYTWVFDASKLNKLSRYELTFAQIAEIAPQQDGVDQLVGDDAPVTPKETFTITLDVYDKVVDIYTFDHKTDRELTSVEAGDKVLFRFNTQDLPPYQVVEFAEERSDLELYFVKWLEQWPMIDDVPSFPMISAAGISNFAFLTTPDHVGVQTLIFEGFDFQYISEEEEAEPAVTNTFKITLVVNPSGAEFIVLAKEEDERQKISHRNLELMGGDKIRVWLPGHDQDGCEIGWVPRLDLIDGQLQNTDSVKKETNAQGEAFTVYSFEAIAPGVAELQFNQLDLCDAGDPLNDLNPNADEVTYTFKVEVLPYR